MMIDKDEVARTVVSVSQACSDGYKRAITNFSTDLERDANEKCSIAASNTGWFILRALGYSSEDMRNIAAGDHPPTNINPKEEG